MGADPPARRRALEAVLAAVLALAAAACTFLLCGHPEFRPPPRRLPAHRRRRLRTGDLLLCRTSNTDFRLSTALTGALYSHVSVIISARDAYRSPLRARHPLVFESNSTGHTPYPDLATGTAHGGWQLHPLHLRLHEYSRRGGWAAVRQLRGGRSLSARLDMVLPGAGAGAGGERRRPDPRAQRFPSGLRMARTAGALSVRDRLGLRGGGGAGGAAADREQDLCCSAFVAHWLQLNKVIQPSVPLHHIYPQMFARVGRTRRGLDTRLGLLDPYSFDPPCVLA